ncbi:hypothetical protein [uncultured Polaribacter sp.]|uniref:hypothetical protein n=1 Tax=uncultured Polaribacter sp. TaxID=174711 RepID=UPI002604158B|nr:hypothetical protein [uncultured Polaribacter sp.]
MKNIIKYVCFAILGGIIITSCENNDDYTGASKMSWTDATVTLSSSQASYTFNETLIDVDDLDTYTATVSASLMEPQPLDAIISFVQTSGNADSDDYTIGEIKIPAGATTASTELSINRNGDIEGTETFVLSAVTDGNFNLASEYNLPVTINNDQIDDTLMFTTTWAGSYTFEAAGPTDVTLDFCNIDFDVLLYTNAGLFVQTLGATGSCTETDSTMENLPDGEYFLVLEVYDNPFTVYDLTEPVPVTVSYSQSNSDSGEFTIADTFTLSSIESVSGTPAETAVATITKSGYNFTVTPL